MQALTNFSRESNGLHTAHASAFGLAAVATDLSRASHGCSGRGEGESREDDESSEEAHVGVIAWTDFSDVVVLLLLRCKMAERVFGV